MKNIQLDLVQRARWVKITPKFVQNIVSFGKVALYLQKNKIAWQNSPNVAKITLHGTTN